MSNEAEDQKNKLTTDRNEPGLRKLRADGQQEAYLVLSEAERAKGFVRPVRYSYRHLTCRGITSMATALAETYARSPGFYSGTYCTTCKQHFNLKDENNNPAFEWMPDGDYVGSNAEEAAAYLAAKKAAEAEKIKGAGI